MRWGTIVAPESMMLSLHVISLALQVVLPILLLGWIARGKSASISGWLAKATTIVLYLGAAHVAGLWVLVPWYTAAVFVMGLVAMGLLQIRRVQQLPWRAPRVAWVSLVTGAIIATFAVAVLVAAARARRVPEEHVVDGSRGPALLDPDLLESHAENIPHVARRGRRRARRAAEASRWRRGLVLAPRGEP
jgi:hypothetical protein